MASAEILISLLLLICTQNQQQSRGTEREWEWETAGYFTVQSFEFQSIFDWPITNSIFLSVLIDKKNKQKQNHILVISLSSFWVQY